MSKGHILIVDDEKNIRSSLSSLLMDEGFEVSQAADGKSALVLLQKERPDVIFLDIWMPGIDGLETLKVIKSLDASLAVVMMSGHGTIETAVKATKLGAVDFVEKPLSIDKILLIIRNILSIQQLRDENNLLREKVGYKFEMISKSAPMKAIINQVEVAAPTHSWILITGENGTGKELVARNIHEKSLRRLKPFVEVNCAAIPEELIESELFGHEKGSFTGAITSKRGKFDLAHDGTLFLDEIGDMSLKTQAKILRVLQEQKFERVGGTKTYNIDVRVIGATNKDLQQEIKDGNFREDLFYRLNVIPIHVPPLKNRKEDIGVLAAHFLRQISRENGKKEKQLSKNALSVLEAHHWPGNVRELKNVVERLFIMTAANEVDIEDLPLNIRESGQTEEFILGDFKNAKMKFEREYILKKLEEFDGNVSKTAKAIGIERSNLHRKIKSYDIEI